MEIRIRCQCGSSLCFEDTPVNGQLEYPFTCTNCGADCTSRANDFIRRQLAGEPEESLPKRKSWWPATRRKPASFHTEEFALRSGRSSLAVQPAPEAELETMSGDETGSSRIALAGTASLVVGVIGAMAWLYVAKATGFEIGYVAWALGGLVGWTSRLVAPRGHPFLGFAATLAAVVAIGGGQYLVARWQIREAVHGYAPAAYGEILAYARETTAALDSEDLSERTAEFKLVRALAGESETNVIGAYQNYQIADSGFSLFGLTHKDQPTLTFAERSKLADVQAVTVPEIARFDAEVAPVLQKLVAGQPSQDEYQASLEDRIHARISASTVAAWAVNRYSILWLFLGIGTAYRLARNPSLQY